ncbi:MAG: urocanate hydratase, partial [Proteobacteria bacterium]
MQITVGNSLPPAPKFEAGIRRAPKREMKLDRVDTELALRNALRYIPESLHAQMAPEFLNELKTHGRIYGFRYRPDTRIHGKALESYKGKCLAGKALQVMIDNNLDFEIALYPYELVTYGETGQVFQNWMQYRLTMQYLEELKDDQTLVLQSGHPLGVFPSHKEAPRVITTNGLMVGLFDNPEDFHRAAAIGVANYGQMTAGGWMYIGPQGIVHGTFNTLSIAGRLKLGIPVDGNLGGKLFISSGLGGMSGAQGKAADIAGAVSIIAEVDRSRIDTRHRQGWVGRVTDDKAEAFRWAKEAQTSKTAVSIAFHGNIVDLLQHAVDEKIKIDLLSDQTSCHAVYEGGYCPQGLSFEERTALLGSDKKKFV